MRMEEEVRTYRCWPTHAHGIEKWGCRWKTKRGIWSFWSRLCSLSFVRGWQRPQSITVTLIVDFLLKTDGGYPKDACVIWCTTATHGNSLCFNTHWSFFFWFLVCYAATQLALQLHPKRIQVVCINRETPEAPGPRAFPQWAYAYTNMQTKEK